MMEGDQSDNSTNIDRKHDNQGNPVNSDECTEKEEQNKGSKRIKKSGKKQKKRDRPGRPPKDRSTKQRTRMGIVEVPHNENNILEFSYDMPQNFKKIWDYFKTSAVDKLRFVFKKDGIVILCEDHYKKNKIRVKIAGEKVNHYFCSEPFDVVVLNRNIEKVMNTIDKKDTREIGISINSDLSNQGSLANLDNIKVIFDNEIKIKSIHELSLINDTEYIEETPFLEEEKYLVKYRLPSSYFKRQINNIKSFNNEILIRKESNETPLLFEYKMEDCKVRSRDIVEEPGRIDLVSNLPNNTPLMIIANIDNIRPISSVQISECVELFIANDRPILYKVVLNDLAIEIKVLIGIE
jgi:hypothetical protein